MNVKYIEFPLFILELLNLKNENFYNINFILLIKFKSNFIILKK